MAAQYQTSAMLHRTTGRAGPRRATAAAGKSNLFLGRSGAGAIAGYMDDPGSGNTAAGHRRWIIDPRQTTMGSGSVMTLRMTTSGMRVERALRPRHRLVAGRAGRHPGVPPVAGGRLRAAADRAERPLVPVRVRLRHRLLARPP